MNDSERDQLLIRVDTNVVRLMSDVSGLEERIRALEAVNQARIGATKTAVMIASAMWAALTAAAALFWNR